jgi:hypothetical protein
LNDFWSFNSQTRNWTQLARGPEARWAHCIEWDEGRNQLLLFSGTSWTAILNDLWTYSIKFDQWELVTPVGTPIPDGRKSHACALNTQTSTFFAQGGTGLQANHGQELWQFNLTSNNWTLIDAGNFNVNRLGHSMRFSKSLNSLLLFFGRNQLSSSNLNTIYQYSFNNTSAGWTLFQVFGSQIPSRRAFISSGFNPLTGEYLVFGGLFGNTDYSIKSRLN